MKKYFVLINAVILSGVVCAQQQTQEVGEANSDFIEGNVQEEIKEISVDKFEEEGFWSAYISSDAGYATSRLFPGGPGTDKKIPIQEEASVGNISDENVFGTKVDFVRRGYTSIYINGMRPIPVEGITKQIMVWVAGRNFNHKLYVLIEDSRGKYFELYMGRLNFTGWKRMMTPVPPQQEGGNNGIIQTDYHYTAASGIRILGFRIDVDPMEAYGSYYVYLDDLRVKTDLFAESYRDPDDPHDDW